MSKKTMTPFEQALLDATLEEFSDIPDHEEEIDVTFSKAFVEKSERLIQNMQRKTWRYVNTTTKRIALIAIIVALLATTVMAFPSIREAIIKFFLHDEGTHYEFSFDPEQAANAPNCIETAYVPSYIPDGYSKSFETINIATVAIGWCNSDNWEIYYNQAPMPDDFKNSTRGGINAEGATTQSIGINGYEVIRIEDAEVVSYVWTNNEYMFTLMCEKAISEEEIEKIFNSVQADPNAVIDGATRINRHTGFLPICRFTFCIEFQISTVLIIRAAKGGGY